MLISETLTIGQITFIFRVLIQLLTYSGLFLFALIILVSVPRVATLSTHDLINRLVGKSTATTSSLSWILGYFTGRSGDHSFPRGLIASVFLFTIYSSLVNLSDIGLLGIYSCTTAWPSYTDSPFSVHDAIAANASVTAALINGTVPSLVNAYRCDSYEFYQLNVNVSEYVCTSWHNGSYGDASFFQNLNTTDSAVLMNRELKNLNSPRFYLNGWHVGPGSGRVKKATIRNGILLQPDATGVRAIAGVPPLPPQRSMQLDSAMAIEADMGCLNLGLFTERNLDALFDDQFDIFATNWTQHYSGPDNMKDTLLKWGARIRSLVRPLFNESSINDRGYLFANGLDNRTASPLGGRPYLTAKVVNWFLPESDSNITDPTHVSVQTALMRNCTEDIYSALGVTLLPNITATGAAAAGLIPSVACSNLAVQGSLASSGFPLAGFSRFICAASSQLNLVSANISSSNDSSLTLAFERHDADLHYTIASWWDVLPVDNETAYVQFEPYERYTLSPSPGSGSRNHPLPAYVALYLNRLKGADGASGVISSLTDFLLSYPASVSADSSGLTNLDDGEAYIDFNETIIPTWAGTIGASFIAESLAYNGWAALDQWQSGTGRIEIQSTGGRPAVCFNLRFGLAFFPLLVAALTTLIWGLVALATSAFKGWTATEASYGGLSPLRATLIPAWAAGDAVLIWQGVPEPHLENCPDGKFVLMPEGNTGGHETVASYLRKHDAPINFMELEQRDGR
ncbi:hypothetical protein C8J57DRAFT_1387334 [Mycena rebaudengoi]|nr:hypothetical protein C8J57DRAFT_1387334 [Mycena rebaudengoi]